MIEPMSTKKIIIIVAIIISILILGTFIRYSFSSAKIGGAIEKAANEDATMGDPIDACGQTCEYAKLSLSDKTACLARCDNARASIEAQRMTDLTQEEVKQKIINDCNTACQSDSPAFGSKANCLEFCANMTN